LTRPVRWARGSSCGRHTEPAGIAAIGPRGPIGQHGIEGDDHIAHHGNDRDLWLLPGVGQATVKGFNNCQNLLFSDYNASPGLLLISQAGNGGTGGSSNTFDQGPSGGPGGGGGDITVSRSTLNISAFGPQSPRG
jgi:hypothetical protein